MSLRKSSNTVKILNPAPGGARYTSRKNAERLVRRGLAAYSRDESELSYLSSEWLRILHSQAAASRADEQHIEARGGVLWWNGCDRSPNACHRPGENVSFPRPDRAKPYLQALERMK